jgi:hypothetical protein
MLASNGSSDYEPDDRCRCGEYADGQTDQLPCAWHGSDSPLDLLDVVIDGSESRFQAGERRLDVGNVTLKLVDPSIHAASTSGCCLKHATALPFVCFQILPVPI